MPLFQPWISVPPALEPDMQRLDTGHFLLQYGRLKLSGSNRLTIAGTTEVYLSEFGSRVPTVYVGVPRLANRSWTVPSGWVHTVEDRLILAIDQRATIEGNADLRIHNDIAPRARLTLEGRGGQV